MAWEIVDAVTGREVWFKYHTVGVGSRRLIEIGNTKIHLIAFLGLVIEHLAREMPADDIRAHWVQNLEKAKILPRNGGDDAFVMNFEGVAGALPLEVKERRRAAAIAHIDAVASTPKGAAVLHGTRFEPQPFVCCGVTFDAFELVKTLEYLLSNVPYESPHDLRFRFFEALCPSWDTSERWRDARSPNSGKRSSTSVAMVGLPIWSAVAVMLAIMGLAWALTGQMNLSAAPASCDPTTGVGCE